MRLGILDFGCVKVIPENYYESYFQLQNADFLKKTDAEIDTMLKELEFISDKDTEEEKTFFKPIFLKMTTLLARPFQTNKFDFGDDAYFKEIFEFGEQISKMKELKNSRTARGSRHGIYINKTYFGLYTILNEMKAEVIIKK